MELAVLVGYAVLTIVMTWPLVLHLDSHFAGRDPDVWINPWATWWTGKALSQGQSLYYTDLMFYPHGVSLAFHSFSHVNAALALILQPVLGVLGAYNVTILLAHALSGYAMFCLVRHLARSGVGAFFAGLVFAFFPYRLSESVHPVIVSTQWMPLYFLFLLRLLDEGHKRYAALAALFFVLTALSSWHLMLFTLFMSVIYLGYRLLFERQCRSRTSVRHLLLLAGVIGLILVPFLYPLLREQLTASDTYIGVDLELGKGSDPVAFLLPAQEHPLWGEWVAPVYERIQRRRAVYLGFTALGLSLVGGVVDWRRVRFWILLGLLGILLSIGPYLQVNGRLFDVIVPWSVPVTWFFRHPLRFNVLVGLALAVASGLGLSALSRRLAARWMRWRRPLASVMMALLLFEYLPLPFPLTEARVPDYGFFTGPEEAGAVLDLPMGRQPAKFYLYYQMTHGRPVVEGVVSRTPLEAYAFIETTPALRSLQACGRAFPLADLSSLMDDLREAGIAYVVLHKDLIKRPYLERWMGVALAAPDYKDEQVAVYRTRAALPPQAGVSQLLEACVAVRPLTTEAVVVSQGEVLQVPLEWVAGNTLEASFALELALVDAAGDVAQRHLYEVTPGAPLTTWYRGQQHTVVYSFQVPPLLSPAVYRLRARLMPEGVEGERLLSAYLMDVQVSARPRRFVLPDVQQAVAATFGADVRLLGYDLAEGEDALGITLYWQALRRMTTDYKFFVHIREVEGGALVAQMDGMPRNWTYPTTWWEAGEVVDDEIVFNRGGGTERDCRLWVGLYRRDTGERLPVSDAPAHLVAGEGGGMLLEEIVTCP